MVQRQKVQRQGMRVQLPYIGRIAKALIMG